MNQHILPKDPAKHSHLPVGTVQASPIPKLVAAYGDQASASFLEFFVATIRNPNTRRAYYRAVQDFFDWCDMRNVIDLRALTPFHIAAFIEELQQTHAAPTVKQRLAAVRMLFDFLVVRQVVPFNPATSVRGPKHVVKKGKTPILSPEETRSLLDSIPIDTVIGLRDRALIATMVYTFARVTAAVSMRVNDYYPNGKRWWVRLHEKGGKQHEMPAHHLLEEYLDAYIKMAGIGDDKKGWLFRTVKGKSGQLTERPMLQQYAYAMIKRRAAAAGIATEIGNHTFRGTGITAYLENGGTLEKAQQMAAHESPRTTKLYDRTSDVVTIAEVEKVQI